MKSSKKFRDVEMYEYFLYEGKEYSKIIKYNGDCHMISETGKFFPCPDKDILVGIVK